MEEIAPQPVVGKGKIRLSQFALYIPPSSNPARSGQAVIHGMTRVTTASIAYIAAQVTIYIWL